MPTDVHNLLLGSFQGHTYFVTSTQFYLYITVRLKGPYFNGLKRKSEVPSAGSFVGGSMAMSLL